MHIFRLTGLTANQPIGTLAAFGLLRRLDQCQLLGQVRLAWEELAEWTAILHVETMCDDDGLIATLTNRNRGCSNSPHVRWRQLNNEPNSVHDDIKMPPPVFRSHLERAVCESNLNTTEYLSYLSAYGSEMVAARSTDDVKPTAFHMTAGQQQFIKSVRELAESLDVAVTPSKRQTPEQRLDEIKAAFRETLFGPWRYEDTQHALGWDPSTEALYAFAARAPAKAGPSSVRAAVWLAFEALPLFPSVPMGTRLVTTAFSSNSDAFSWPVWRQPITVQALKSLLFSADLMRPCPFTDRLRDMGVAMVFRSRRDTDPNGRGQLRPAYVCPRVLRRDA